MQRLTKNSREYLDVLFAIYRTCEYCEKSMGFVIEPDVTALSANIREKDGITFLRFNIPVRSDFKPEYPLTKYQNVLQEILDLVQSTEVHLVTNAFSIGAMERLYVDNMAYYNSGVYLDIVYIDNPTAFSYVRSKKWKPAI